MKKVLILLIVVMLSEVEASKGQTYVVIPDANFVTYLQSIIPAAMNGNQMDITNTLVTTTTHTINVYGRNIANLSGAQYFTSLTYLDCSSNSLTTLPTLPNSLTYLDCSWNSSLRYLPALPNTLQQLYCASDSLTNLPSLPNSLTYLDCSWNSSLRYLPVLPNSLTFLGCIGVSLTNLPALPNSLTSLYCNANYLTSLPALPNSLTHLVCDQNSLTSLPVLPNSLAYLDCHENNIPCFPTFPNSITSLRIDQNPYNCLPNYVAGFNSSIAPLCAAGNSNGCAVAGIEQYANSNAVSIYPNPASTIINLKLEIINENTTLQITDMLGNTVKQFSIHNSPFQISVSDLAEGVYQLIIHPADGGTITKKVVIVK